MMILFWFKNNFPWKACCIFWCLCLLGGCGELATRDYPASTEEVARDLHWQKLLLPTSPFQLRAYLNSNTTDDGVLTIYIEGDGSSWIHGEYPSSDPTPQNPMALKLALAQPSGAVAYLARPCQFIGLSNLELCNAEAWTSARYSQGAVDSTEQAIDLLKAQVDAKRIILVGYSGGAAIALLVAAQRNDVIQIILVAGNVNPHQWAHDLGMQSLTGSLDPREVIPSLVTIPQVYLVGGKDQILPLDLTAGFIDLFPRNNHIKLIEFEKNGHVCCWVDQWPLLWTKIRRTE